MTQHPRLRIPSIPRTARLMLALVIPLLAIGLGGLGGCAVVSVAGAAAGAAISVTGAVVSTGVTVTGKVLGKAIDAVTPGN